MNWKEASATLCSHPRRKNTALYTARNPGRWCTTVFQREYSSARSNTSWKRLCTVILQSPVIFILGFGKKNTVQSITSRFRRVWEKSRSSFCRSSISQRISNVFTIEFFGSRVLLREYTTIKSSSIILRSPSLSSSCLRRNGKTVSAVRAYGKSFSNRYRVHHARWKPFLVVQLRNQRQNPLDLNLLLWQVLLLSVRLFRILSQ